MSVDRIDEALLRVEIAERVRNRRKELGLTQDVLAIRAEISKSFMSEVESGITTANGLIYVRLARGLNCTVQYLLTGEASPRQSKVATQLERIVDALNGVGQKLDHFDERVGRALDELIEETRKVRGDR